MDDDFMRDFFNMKPKAKVDMSMRDYFMAHAPITVADAIQCCGFIDGDGLGPDTQSQAFPSSRD